MTLRGDKPYGPAMPLPAELTGAVAAAGLGADLGVAAAAFVGTNVDNCVVTMAMVAGAPLERAHRIAAGQVVGFVVLVAVVRRGGGRAVRVLGRPSSACSGWCRWPSACAAWSGLRTTGAAAATRAGRPAAGGALARAEQRAVGRSLTAAALVTIAAGGDNLAVYIPLFRVGGRPAGRHRRRLRGR